MEVCIELFVKELEKSFYFYTEVLRFKCLGMNQNMARMKNGNVDILLTSQFILQPNHYFDAESLGKRKGIGVEVMLILNDIEEMYNHVKAKNYPIISPLQKQPWGMIDFRIADPDGYYLRLTSKRKDSTFSSLG